MDDRPCSPAPFLLGPFARRWPQCYTFSTYETANGREWTRIEEGTTYDLCQICHLRSFVFICGEPEEKPLMDANRRE